MTVEGLKTAFDWAAVILLFLTFAAGSGVLVTGNIINRRQEGKLRAFDNDLTSAKMSLAKQQERAANADERASRIEAGNLQLRTDLEDATAESRSAQSRLEEEQRKTAKAQKEAADAQSALQGHINEVAKRQGQRLLDFKKFVAFLRGKPKGAVRILYSPNDPEAYTFAVHIRRWLGLGVDGDGAGWDVSAPVPVPPEGGDPHPDLANAPPAMKYGAWSGLGILTGDSIEGHHPFWEDKTTMGALVSALMDNGFNPVSHFGVAPMPKGVMILVVGQKP
jgi:hypothetical protein